MLFVTTITLKVERDKYGISSKNFQERGCFRNVWVDVRVKLNGYKSVLM
jgi:hypothetical protein